MRIIHIITGLNNGGAEAILYRLCKYNKSNEHIVISMMDKGKYGQLLENENIKVYTLGMPTGKLTFRGIVNLYKLINKFNPDIVQTWMYHANLIGGIIAKFSGIKKIVWGIHHSSLDETHNKKSTIFIAKILGKISNIVPTNIIFCAEKSYEVHKSIGYKCKNMKVVANGYELDKFYPNDENVKNLKNQFELNNTKNIIGLVARFDELKDHNNLLHSLQLVKKSAIDFKCLLIGANILNTNVELINMINKYDLIKNIVLLGERNDIPNIMNLLDIHVLSSYSEAFPNVLCEAMACGIPCITTDVGDASFIVSNTGFVVPVKDPESMSEKIIKILHEKENDTIGWENRKLKVRERIVENFSIEKMIKNYEMIWNDI
jgi:glycosyltransferase involved in cell wall biosynthesis